MNKQIKKLWYAVERNRDDNDWGYGSFNLNEAINMAKNISNESIISVIDGDYDDDGNAQTDPICVDELINGEDF